jgi:hypothetical protein
MANWQLEQKSEARAALAKGDASAPGLLPEDGTRDLGESWVAWLFARISLDEATVLIYPAPAAESNSNTLQQEASSSNK